MTPDPIRLLLVSDSYPPLIGGADMQVQMIARAMRDAGHAVTVATPWQPGLDLREDDGGVAVHRTRALATRVPWFAKDPGRRHHPPFPDPGTTLELRRLVRELRPDVAHSYGWISYSTAAALLGTDVPLLLSARDYGYICAVRNFLYYQGRVCSGPSLAKCLRCAAHTYTQDEAGNAVLGRAGTPVTARHRVRGAGKAMAAVGSIYLGWPLLTRRLRGLHSVSTFVRGVMDRFLLQSRTSREVRVDVDEVIPSFLPPQERDKPDPALLARLPDEPYILFVGALLPQKGIWPLLAAYRLLQAPAPPLVLLGPSSYKSPTELPDGVLALGGTTHATVMAAWDRALFGVVPSVGAETFGNVVTEAMSRGRAVVASRLGGIVDIIEDGRSGLLVPPNDPAALAAAMQGLIDDPALRDRLGAAARDRVQLYAASRVLPRFEALYRELIAARRTAGPG
ncbi:MAG TPA: glycosyltransferase family 4 protein [Candidatus Limnocylindrales bacterium]|nr:glycosyltransferase family 4 protein [Candidatus Limnocylindrales bacterium]